MLDIQYLYIYRSVVHFATDITLDVKYLICAIISSLFSLSACPLFLSFVVGVDNLESVSLGVN